MSEPDLTVAFNEGIRDYRAGVDRKKGPYGPKTNAGGSWDRGWDAAEHDPDLKPTLPEKPAEPEKAATQELEPPFPLTIAAGVDFLDRVLELNQLTLRVEGGGFNYPHAFGFAGCKVIGDPALVALRDVLRKCRQVIRMAGKPHTTGTGALELLAPLSAPSESPAPAG